MINNKWKLISFGLVPKSCHIYKLRGATESGTYQIDPDGQGKLAPFNAHCDFENGKRKWFFLCEFKIIQMFYLFIKRVNDIQPGIFDIL